MRRTKWMIPLIAIAIFLSSVGLASAHMTGTLLETSDNAASVDAKQLAQAEKKVGTRKGYVGVFNFFTAPTTEAGVSADLTAPTTGPEAFTLTIKRRDVVVVTAAEQEGLVIRIPEEGGLEAITRFPGPGGAAEVSATSANLDGAEVAVLVEFILDEDDNIVPEARQIIVKPIPNTPISGAVASVDTNDEGVSTLTIVDADGNAEEVELAPEVDVPAVGEVVVAFRGRGARVGRSGDEDDSDAPKVKGLVRAQEVHDRLLAFIENLAPDGDDLSDEAAERRAQRVERVEGILAKHAARRVAILEKLSGRQNLSPRASEAFANGLDTAIAARDSAEAAREAAQAAREEAAAARENAEPGRQDQDRGPRNQR